MRRDEDARLEAEARTHARCGDHGAALASLRRQVVLLARHEATTLPCLCERCLDPALETTEAAGVAWVRDFVVARHRALFYWMPAELAGRTRQVRASMRAEIRDRLRTRSGAVPVRDKQRMLDPFAGKR
jgi:hypothetical protein